MIPTRTAAECADLASRQAGGEELGFSQEFVHSWQDWQPAEPVPAEVPAPAVPAPAVVGPAPVVLDPPAAAKSLPPPTPAKPGHDRPVARG